MDITGADPPPNTIAMAAVQKDYTSKNGGKDCSKSDSGPKGGGNKATNWKYALPKPGELETQTTKTKLNGSKKKHIWCVHIQCKCWTLSHTTSGHGQRKGRGGGNNRKPPKLEGLKIQSSLKTFLANPTANKLTKKDRKQLQALLTTMHQSDDSDAGSVDSN
jgi:hypothetical protein